MVRLQIAELLFKKRMKQIDLVRLTGIRPSTISAYWNGTAKRIDVNHLNLLWKALECEPWELFEWSNDK